MRLREHVLKARRIEASLRRLDPARDFEMLIDLSMLAATQLFNAAMHSEGITHGHSDQSHTHLPPMDTYQKQPGAEIRRGMKALAYIEDLRPIYVRGGEPYDPAVADKCLASFEEAKEAFLGVLGDDAQVPDWAGEAPGEGRATP